MNNLSTKEREKLSAAMHNTLKTKSTTSSEYLTQTNIMRANYIDAVVNLPAYQLALVLLVAEQLKDLIDSNLNGVTTVKNVMVSFYVTEETAEYALKTAGFVHQNDEIWRNADGDSGIMFLRPIRRKDLF